MLHILLLKRHDIFIWVKFGVKVGQHVLLDGGRNSAEA